MAESQQRRSGTVFLGPVGNPALDAPFISCGVLDPLPDDLIVGLVMDEALRNKDGADQ